METVTIPIQELNVLRETLTMAFEILNRHGVTGNLIVPGAAPKETSKQRKNKYARMLETKSRGTKPEYLKKSNAKSSKNGN